MRILDAIAVALALSLGAAAEPRFHPPAPPAPLADEIAREVARLGETRRRAPAGLRREQAVERLAEIGWPAIPALGEAILDRASWFRRANAAQALAAIAEGPRGPITDLLLYRAVPALAEVLETDTEEWPLRRAAEALTSITGYSPPPDEPPAQAWRAFYERVGAQHLALLESDALAPDFAKNSGELDRLEKPARPPSWTIEGP